MANPFTQRETLLSDPAELALIGAAIFDAGRCEAVLTRVQPLHFADPMNGRVWEVIAGLAQHDRATSPHLVAAAFGQDDSFAAWGGGDHLVALAETADLGAIEQNADLVHDLAVRRSAIRLARVAQGQAADTSKASGVEVLAELEQGVADLARDASTNEQWITAGDAIAGAIKHAQERQGRIEFPFGIADLDAKTGGMNAAEMTVLGAWTGMGKTMAGMQVAKTNALQGLATIYISLEMDRNPLGMRLACDLAYDRYDGGGPHIDAAMKGMLGLDDWQKLREAQATAAGMNLLFEVRPGWTVAQITSFVRRQHRRWAKAGIKIGPVFVDHIGLVKPATDRRGDRTSELTDVSNGLAAMAKVLRVPVVALAQLNRNADAMNDADKRPKLAHIKQANAIAEDARQVILIFRPEYYLREALEHETAEQKIERLEKLDKVKGHFYWLIEKNSNGPRGQVLSFCEASCGAIRNGPP